MLDAVGLPVSRPRGVHASTGVHACVTLPVSAAALCGPANTPIVVCTQGRFPASLLAYESFSVRTRVPIIPCVSGLLLNTTSFSAALAAGVPVLGGAGGRWEKCIDEL